MSRDGARYPFHFAFFLMAYYMANSAYQGFITIYFQDVGLSTAQIGALMAAVPLVSIFSQPLWGGLGDRMKSRNALLVALTGGSAVFILAFLINSWFAWLLAVICLFACTYTALQPMGDSIILESLQKNRQPFGPIRLAGCLAFALSSKIFGGLVDQSSAWAIYLTAIMLGLTLISVRSLPPTRGHQLSGQRASMADILKLPNMKGLLGFITLLQLTMGYFYSFFPVHFTQLPGGNASLLGWCYLISAASEVPFLLVCDRLFDRLGAGKLMAISAAALTARWIILSTVNSVAWVMASQLLHGWGFIVMTVSMSKYISLSVPDHLRARGQMLLAVVGFGLARVVGNFGGGLIASQVGIQRAFLLCALVSGGALLFFAPKYLKRPALNGRH